MKTEDKKRDFILSVVSKYSGLSLEDLKEKTRKRSVSQNRQIACYFLFVYWKGLQESMQLCCSVRLIRDPNEHILLIRRNIN